MKIFTKSPVIEQKSEIRGGRGGHGGARHSSGVRKYPRSGGYYYNGSYWVDVNGLCYTKNWLGEYMLVNCSNVPSVALGL